MSDIFEVVALSASSDRSAAKAAAKYPGLFFTRDYHELVTHPDVDAVVVQTPIPLNAAVAMAALRAGKNVIGEKPIGLGYLLDAGVHQIATLSMLFGHPREVQAISVKLRPEYGAVDQAVMLFEYPGGVHGIFSHSGMLTDQRNYFFIRGTEGVIEILRDEMWRAIADAIVSGQKAPYTPEMASRDVCILDAVDHALALNQKQSIARSL